MYTTAEYNKLGQERGSNLCKILTSGLEYKRAVENPKPATDAMNFGQLVDNMWLDQSQLEKDFVYYRFEDRPDKGRILKSGKNKGQWTDHTLNTDLNKAWIEGLRLEARKGGKELVSWEDVAKAQDLVNYVQNEATDHESAKARYWLNIVEGEAQKTGFWTDPITGIECKGRIDRDTESACVDLKVYQKFGPDDFPHAVREYHLDMKAVLYMNIFKRVMFVWVVIQPEKPHQVCIYRMFEGTPEYQVGANKLRRALDRLKLCQDTGIWPGVGGMPHPWKDEISGEFVLTSPGWYLNKWGV